MTSLKCTLLLLSVTLTLAYGEENPKAFQGLPSSLKIAVQENGVYRVRYEDLRQYGIVSSPIPSKEVALLGLPAGRLSPFNDASIPDGLAAWPLRIEDGGDREFGPGDSFLFYGQSPDIIAFDPTDTTGLFTVAVHPYSQYQYYFICRDSTRHNPMQTAREISDPAEKTITAFPDCIHHKKELNNPFNGSEKWTGEAFTDSRASLAFDFALPSANPEESPKLHWGLVWRGSQKVEFLSSPEFSYTIACNGYAQENTISFSRERFGSQNGHSPFPFASDPHVEIRCVKQDSLVDIYLDYLQISYLRNLEMENSRPLFFRAPSARGYRSEFRIAQADSEVIVWETDQPAQTRQIPVRTENRQIRFTVPASDSLKEFVAFRPDQTRSPEFIGLRQAQNLHACKDKDYVIVSHPDFEQQARSLARWHETHNGYRSCVVTTEQVYNEFSSGAQDPSAIRLFMKRLYDNATSQADRPKYLLLFGAVSYDYKNLLETHSNFVPTLAPSSENPETRAYLGEDNFAYLEQDEGYRNRTYRGDMDIAVGRLPVRTVSQAGDMVEKIEIYGSSTLFPEFPGRDKEGNFGSWRNEIAFIGSEEFLSFIEKPAFFAQAVAQHFPRPNIRKIYQALTDSLPDITLTRKKIADCFNTGCLFIGYYGHSAPSAWGNRKLLTSDDIRSWDFTYTYPILFSSSCSFAVMDNPFEVSGAELSVLQPHGGCIATIGGTGILYVGNIEQIQTDFILKLLESSPENPLAIGDAWLYAKNKNLARSADGLVLLGDPGLKVSVPRYRIRTDSLNDAIPDAGDTLRGWSEVRLTGSVTRADGSLIEDFNGVLQYKIFGPEEIRQKDDGYNGLQIIEYRSRETVLAAGRAEVKNGIFHTSFRLPGLPAAVGGQGKISYYAYSSDYGDASGYTDSFFFGGIDSTAVVDTRPPIIRPEIVYRNAFSGEEIIQIPYLQAEIYDRNGLDISEAAYSRGLGLYIDEAEREEVSAYFRFYPGSGREGVLEYPLILPEGRHRLEIEAWNIFGIPATARTFFTGTDIEIPETAESSLQITAVPNPALPIGYTDFYFGPDLNPAFSSCMLEVFDMRGRCVARKRFDLNGISNRKHTVLRWDRAETGTKPGSGLHVCRFVFFSPDGKAVDSRSCKLIVL